MLFVQKIKKKISGLFFKFKNFRLLNVSKYQRQFMVSKLLPKKPTNLTILSIFITQESEFRSFFGTNFDIINCFWYLLTFISYSPILRFSHYFSDFLISYGKLRLFKYSGSPLSRRFCDFIETASVHWYLTNKVEKKGERNNVSSKS